MEEEYDELRGPFRRWLAARWADVEDLRVGQPESPKSGFSARTLFVPLKLRRAGLECEERLVLRLENPEPAIYPQQAPGLDVEVAIQYRTMETLARVAKIPLAGLIGYEPDPQVLGAPFYVMRHIEGQVPVEDPIYTKEGFFTEASPKQRRRLVEGGLRVLAEIHRVDWKAAEFEWLVPPGEAPDALRQLTLWEDYGQRELGDREHPSLARAFQWLHANLPTTQAPALSWGDSRPGNVIWRDFAPACVTDFENVAIAPPEVDLGWWLMFDRWSHETCGVGRLPGEPTREEQRDFYAACTGRAVGDTFWFELFGAARYGAIVVRVMNRLVDRGLLGADQMIWLQNPAATCLDQLLAEGGIGVPV
jgi:aminoglycoside phosphotransferase (APT) family kinase protein